MGVKQDIDHIYIVKVSWISDVLIGTFVAVRKPTKPVDKRDY